MNVKGGKNKNDIKWTTFKHNGVMFPEPYKPHRIPILYDGDEIILEPKSEEFATIYSKYTGTDYINHKKFKNNFFKDWKKILKKDGYTQITDFDKVNFSKIYNYLLNKKDKTKEEKEKEKEEREKKEKKYKYAYVDGKREEVGNFRIEPAGLFMGRGCHPLAGKIKRTILPEDIILNIDKESEIPNLPSFYKNHKWGNIISDNTKEWLASWKDNITGKTKYVWLSNQSTFKSKSDQYKFDLAKKLNENIEKIMNINSINITNPRTDIKVKQHAVATYLINKLALRVGNEKGDDEADTVGVCSLRVEHINLEDDNVIKFDFLGKDSVRYKKNVEVDSDVYSNLIKFVNNKSKKDYLFDYITTLSLNEYLRNFMEDLSAKVFRTFNSSKLFQDEINKINEKYKNYKKDDLKDILKNQYIKANIKVADLCNHQKNVAKSSLEQIKKINVKMKELKDKKSKLTDKKKIKKINEKIKILKNKKELKNDMKNLSLGTSQMNYIDPRITYTFVKKHKLNIDNFFTKKLQEKFWWAKDVDKHWNF